MAAANSNFTVFELIQSSHEEDRQLARRSKEVVQAIMVELKPVLQYIATPILLARSDRRECPRLKNASADLPLDARAQRPKAIKISKGYDPGTARQLFVGEDGAFFTARDCGLGETHYHELYESTAGQPVWEFYPFEVVVLGLRDAFAEAKEKRERHLASITARLAMLNRIAEVITDSKAVR